MKQIIISVIIITLIPGFFSCNRPGNTVYKNVTGKPGEMLVVISKEAWNDTTGSLVRSTLAQPHPALPQDEPLFDLINIPPEAFKEIFKTTRNILQCRISKTFEKPAIEFQNNVWAFPQSAATIEARNTMEFDSLFIANSDKLLNHFLKGERENLTMIYDQYHEKAVYKFLQNNFKLLLKTAPGFKIAQKSNNHAWLRYETPDISQGIFLYTYRYTSDSTFTKKYLIEKRDSMLRLFVPGPTEGSYMATEKRIDPIFRIFEHNTNYASEMRGLWKVENNYMGGPYIALTELDPQRQRIVEVYGYVYSPGKNKRNLLRQVEAMIYSLQFDGQEINKKINSQVKMGN